MAKMPDPVKKKAVKSAVSRSKAIEKASIAEAKASRGQVMQKARYPKMSTASGAAEAAKRGAGKARNSMGGFGKTKARPMISNEGKVANQASRRKAIAERKSINATRSASAKKRNAIGGGFGASTAEARQAAADRKTQAAATRSNAAKKRNAVGGGMGKTRSRSEASAKKRNAIGGGFGMTKTSKNYSPSKPKRKSSPRLPETR